MISLIHPSRGRPAKAKQTLNLWLQKSSKSIKIEHIITIDSDDSKLYSYQQFFKDVSISDSRCVVEATNYGTSLATGNILIYLSDDFSCPLNWDLLVMEKFKNITEPLLLKSDDCLQPFGVDVVTIPIMNRELYNKLGYFWNPIYKSMYVDQDLYWTCKNNNWLSLAPDLKFPHNHYCNGKARKDETYIRTDRHSATGKLIYEQRKNNNFPL
jgi:hypothetical protein